MLLRAIKGRLVINLRWNDGKLSA